MHTEVSILLWAPQLIQDLDLYFQICETKLDIPVQVPQCRYALTLC